MTSALAGKVIDYDGSGNKKDAICAHYNGLRGEIHDDFTKNEGVLPWISQNIEVLNIL